LPGESNGADWPQLQGGPQRLGYSPEKLDVPLKNTWAHGFAPERLHPQAQPVVAERRVLIGTAMGTFYCFDAKDGKVLWAQKLAGPVLHTAGVEAGRVFVGCMDGCVYAFNTADGSLAWKFDCKLRTGFSTAVLLAEKKVFIANRGGVYYALAQEDGSVLWQQDLGVPILMSSAYDGGTIYCGAMDLRVYALHSANGKVLWKSRLLDGAAFKDYWPVVHGHYVLVRPAPLSGPQYWKAVEWQRGPLPPAELEKQQQIVQYYEKNPRSRNLFVLERRSGEEALVVPQWMCGTMNGAPAPPCIDADGLLIVPVQLHDWRAGWGRLDLEKRRIVEVLCDGDFEFFAKRQSMRGTGNGDENLNLSAVGRLVLTIHTEECNAHFTGAWHLDRRDWTQIAPYHAETFYITNTQGGGGNPMVVADGMLYHTSWNTLNARTASPAK
jgi:hypothetical protein